MTTAEAYSVRHVTIDSRDRDADLFPLATEFDVLLEEPIKDVTSVALRSWKVPPVLPVAQGRDSLWIEDANGDVHRVHAPFAYRAAGDEAGFLAALSGLATAATGQSFSVAAAAGGAVTVSSPASFAVYSGDPSVAVWAPREDPASIDDKPFEIRNRQPTESPRFTCGRLGDGYGPDSAARALGFARGRTESEPDGAGAFVARAPHLHSLNTPETAYVRIKEAPGFGVPVTGVPTGPNSCLAIVEGDGVGSAQPGASLVEKKFHPPLSKLHRVSVSVVDYFGGSLRTDNRELRLDFTVCTGPANAGADGGFAINNAAKQKQYEQHAPPVAQAGDPFINGAFAAPPGAPEVLSASLRTMHASEAARFVFPKHQAPGFF